MSAKSWGSLTLRPLRMRSVRAPSQDRQVPTPVGALIISLMVYAGSFHRGPR